MMMNTEMTTAKALDMAALAILGWLLIGASLKGVASFVAFFCLGVLMGRIYLDGET